MESLSEQMVKLIKNPVKMMLTAEDYIKMNTQEDCHICEKPLNEEYVLDHCHFTGVFRGKAHATWHIDPVWIRYTIDTLFPLSFII